VDAELIEPAPFRADPPPTRVQRAPLPDEDLR